MAERTCTVCGGPITDGLRIDSRNKYCGSECWRESRKVERTCVVCSAVWRTQRVDAQFCTDQCKGQRYAITKRQVWPHSRVFPRSCSRCAAVFIARRGNVTICGSCPANPTFQAGHCRRCGDPFVMAWINRPVYYCSTRCARSDGKDHRRALKASAFVEPVYRRRVYDRDGWRCGICGKQTKRSAVVPHPRAPTIDHVVPLAAGGEHSMANAQCAHFICNALKGERGPAAGAGEQLRLIG